jgi:hypothetical protein
MQGNSMSYSRPSSPTFAISPRNSMSSVRKPMSSPRNSMSSPRASPIRSPRGLEVRGHWSGHNDYLDRNKYLDRVGGHEGMKFKCKEKYGQMKCKVHDYNHNNHNKFDYEKYINNGSRAHNKMLSEVGGCGCNTCDADKYLEKSSKRYLSNVGGWSCGGDSRTMRRQLGQVGQDYKKYTPTAYENRLMNDVINGRDRREFLERFPVRDLNNPTKQDYINVRVFEAGKM